MESMKPSDPDDDPFARHVAEALNIIPEEFRTRMENVEVLVEDFSDRETLDSLGLSSKWSLLGLYVGVPLSHRSVFSTPGLPETIILYKRPIMRAAPNAGDLPQMVRDVIIHELGHHFGFTDDELYAMTESEE